MIYLIDGHNLIARTPGMSLEDPNDEAKLVLRLRRWAAGERKRQVVVVFDGGLPGGQSRLSTSQVAVHFAADNSTADALLIGRIQQARHPADYTVVSSDRVVLAAAAARRMPSLLSESFALKLAPPPAPAPAGPQAEHEARQAGLSPADVAEWLALFGPVPERQAPQIPARPAASVRPPGQPAAPANEPPRKPARLTTLKSSERPLSQDEVADWLELFKNGGEPP